MEEDQNLLLSIIVPVYNVEEYIRPCMESIFQQGLDEDCFEVIIVNDGTKDHSMEVIQDIIEQHKNIIVLNQENQGLSVARNNGIAKAKGEYILMPDSDDLLIENSLKPLLEKAIETKVDLIVADFRVMTNEEIGSAYNYSQKQETELNFTEKTGIQLFLEDLNPIQSFVWRVLYKREFLQKSHISFFPCITYQDRPFIHECYLRANKCLKASHLLYIYRKGHSTAASFALTEKKAKDYCMSIVLIWDLAKKQNMSQEVLQKLYENVFRCCSILMTRVSHENNDYTSRNRIVDYFNEIAPQIYLRNGIKQRMYFFLLKKMPHTFINCRYIYAKVYEERIHVYLKLFFQNLPVCQNNKSTTNCLIKWIERLTVDRQ